MPVEDAAAPAGPPGAAQDVVVQVLRHGPLPRSQVARRLGLSNGSLTRLSKPLLRSGLLVENPQTPDPESRRPTRPLDVAVHRHRFVGVDVTGAEAWAVLTDLRTTVLAAERAPLAGTSPADVVRAVELLVTSLVDGDLDGVDAVGVALGGYVSAPGVVEHAAFLGWDRPVRLGEMVAEALGRPVVVGNDLAALTRSEHWFGEGRGERSFAVVTVGAGVGYGLVLHDQLVETADTGLQLLGHHPLEPGGPRCPSGHRGCASALLTIPAIAAAGSVATGRQTTFAQVVDQAASGAVAARMVVDDAARHLGTLVAAVANLTSVDRILLTGEGVRFAQVGQASLLAAVQAHRDPAAAPVRVVHRRHDFFSWARGAAGMAVQSFVAGREWFADPAPR